MSPTPSPAKMEEVVEEEEVEQEVEYEEEEVRQQEVPQKVEQEVTVPQVHTYIGSGICDVLRLQLQHSTCLIVKLLQYTGR